jgi:hypothetical protein
MPQPKKKRQEPYVVKVDREVHEQMAVLAKRNERTVSGEIRYALRLYIAEHAAEGGR